MRTNNKVQILQMVLSCVSCLCLTATANAVDVVVDFEDLSLPPDSFYDGNDGGSTAVVVDGSFQSRGVTFPNEFEREFFGNFAYESWDGWSYSNQTNTINPSFTNQYSAFPGSGSGGSTNFGVSFDELNSAISIGDDFEFKSIDITNTTYTALVIQQGNSFSKRFGGATGDDPDYFKLTITGLDGGEMGTVVDSIEFYLADYRFSDNSQDYVVDEWTTVDLTSLAGADTLTFAYESTDNDQILGPNTPLFFAADNLVLSQNVVPEPASFWTAVLCGLAIWYWKKGR
jgi:hypothetical protein